MPCDRTICGGTGESNGWLQKDMSKIPQDRNEWDHGGEEPSGEYSMMGKLTAGALGFRGSRSQGFDVKAVRNRRTKSTSSGTNVQLSYFYPVRLNF
jgi:hypothetical protein